MTPEPGGRCRPDRAAAFAAGAWLLVLLACTGCATTHGAPGAGARFEWRRLPAAAKSAALDPVTWAPAAGALVTSAGGLDARATAWVVRTGPLFGSASAARGASDRLQHALLAEAHLTGLLTPSPPAPAPWIAAKLEDALLREAGLRAVGFATDGLKDFTRRERPDGLDRRSFPSGHTSAAFAGARLSNRNLDAIDMNPAARVAVQTVHLAAASAVGWARIEGRRHHLSDVLAGAALGNFLSAFVHDAFIGAGRDAVSVDVGVDPGAPGVRCAVRWRY